MKNRTPFAESKDGRLFVEVASLMHPMTAVIDGLPLTFFGSEKKAYLAVDDATAWAEKEAAGRPQDRGVFEKAVAVMRRAKSDHAAGVTRYADEN